MRPHLPLLTCAIALVQITSAYAANTLAFGPAIVLTESITPGADATDVFGTSGMTFQIYNRGKEAQWYNLAIERPSDKKWSFEVGYEAIPDVKWCKLDTYEIEVPANSSGKVKATLQVPDKAEYYNRKWMVMVVCAPGKKPAGPDQSVVGLRVASRIMIETAPKTDGDGANAGKIAMWPGSMTSGAQAGAFIDEFFSVRNNTDKEQKYTTLRLKDAEKDAERHERYFGKGYDGVVKETWIDSEPTFTLKPGETKKLRVDTKVPDSVAKGKNYEELLFVKDEEGNANFVRVRIEVPGPATAQKP